MVRKGGKSDMVGLSFFSLCDENHTRQLSCWQVFTLDACKPVKLLGMKQPVLQGDAFLDDVRSVSVEDSSLHIWWLGQSGFLVGWQGQHLLFDPYLSDSLTKKYVDTEKPHVRMTERVIAPERLDFIDVVTSSHNHTDHLDGETLRPLMKANPDLKVIVPRANLDFAAKRLQVLPERLSPISVTEPLILKGIEFHAVPAAHERLEQDVIGHYKCIGFVAKLGPWALYHSGDTMLYDGIEEVLQPFDIDVAFLPINGRDPARGVAGNLSGQETVSLAQGTGASLVIPCHFDMFEFNTVSPEAFVEAAQKAEQPYALLKNGERVSLPEKQGS